MLQSTAVACVPICATNSADAAQVELVNPQVGNVKPCVVKLERIGGDLQEDAAGGPARIGLPG